MGDMGVKGDMGVGCGWGMREGMGVRRYAAMDAAISIISRYLPGSPCLFPLVAMPVSTSCHACCH